jgi:hypothetical protein
MSNVLDFMTRPLYRDAAGEVSKDCQNSGSDVHAAWMETRGRFFPDPRSSIHPDPATALDIGASRSGAPARVPHSQACALRNLMAETSALPAELAWSIQPRHSMKTKDAKKETKKKPTKTPKEKKLAKKEKKNSR